MLLTFFLIILGAKLEVIFTVIIISFVFYILSFLFFNLEIIDKLNFFDRQIKKIVSADTFNVENNYEEKINELNNVLAELNAKEKYFRTNKEIFDLYKNLILLINRLINELNIAKIFKINRNEFLGNVTHELRTPIFTIQLSLETLIDGAIKDDSVNMDFLKRALSQTIRMRQLVDDLINISRLETGMKISKRYFEINTFINNLVNELTELTKSKNVKISVESQVSDKTRVFADEDRLKQVMVNLIDNATKYTNGDGEIKIGIRKTDRDIIISVEDNGVGIPKDDLPRIFERFYRVDKTRSRDMGGSGLGLSIVKHILELHYSSIKVESEEGKGTKFEFNLPS